VGFFEDMEALKRGMKQLETEYEQWFAGALRQPPWATKKKVEGIIRNYSRTPPQNLAEQAVFQMHQAKFTTYSEMWNRRMRLQEEGRLLTGREERSKRVPAPSPTTDEPSHRATKDKTGDEFRKIFDKYVAAKQEVGQSTRNLNYDSFRKVLSKQAKQLRSGGYKKVDFGVSMKGGKVSVVARPKK
jgi:hypothetical protein